MDGMESEGVASGRVGTDAIEADAMETDADAEAVTITASITGDTLSVSPCSVIPPKLSGGFTLHLVLPDGALGSSEPSLQKTSLIRASDQTRLDTVLLLNETPPPPHRVDPGKRLNVVVAIGDRPTMADGDSSTTAGGQS